MLRNSFLEALTSSIENQVDLSSVDAAPKEEKGFLKKLFGSGDDKDNKDEKKKKEKKED